jgi:hypothetical protein
MQPEPKWHPLPPQQESRNMSGLVSGICGFVIVK